MVRPYAQKAKWKDPEQPVKWLTDMFNKYVPGTIFEMRKSFSHITPLGTMNWVTTLVNILEGCLKPENLSNKADQALFEMYFVFAVIWAFGGALVEKDGIAYRKWEAWLQLLPPCLTVPAALPQCHCCAALYHGYV